ncbi:MAG: hypothetical protein Kow00107_10770 [Planctomycetota bacterium]
MEASKPLLKVKLPLIQTVYRYLWILLGGELVLFGFALQNYRAVSSRLLTQDLDPAAITMTVQASQRLELGIALAALAFLSVLSVLLVRSILKASRHPLCVFEDGLLLPLTGAYVGFDGIKSVVFATGERSGDLLIMEGVLADAQNAPHTTIERVLLSPHLVTDAQTATELLEAKDTHVIKKLHYLPKNEEIASLIASVLAKRGAKVFSLVNKFRKQRVIWPED